MKDTETENGIENEDDTQVGYSGVKQKCSMCQEELESDTENEHEKKRCTKFTWLSYSGISNLDFDLCDD